MIQGILQTRDYESFFILSDTGERIYEFSSAKKANKCFAGDHIKWNSEKGLCELELRDEHPIIVGTIELTNKSKYGLTSRGIPIYLFTPYDKRYPHFIVGCSEKDVTYNKIGLIKFDDWKNTTFPRGQLQQILGNSGDFEAEKQALIHQASPWKYPKGEWKPDSKELTKREIISGFTFNIDPEGCKDIDDVLTFEEIPDGGYRVTITISDVATYVQDSSVEDIFASLISQTLYLDGKVQRPMLPSEYSEKVCSLLENKQSYGVSLRFIWNGLNISNIEWLESILINNKSYTYEEFQTSDSPYRIPLAQIASYLAKTDVTDSHKWIEEMMKFYNIEAARLLKDKKLGILRRHNQPNIEKLEMYKESGLEELEFMAYSSAEYCIAEEDETTHFGLQTNTYTHATSPIRRYADLINQRVLKLIIQKKDEGYIVPVAMYDMNYRQKTIKGYERDMCFLNAIQSSNIFNGVIINRKKIENDLKIWVYVKEWKKVITSKYKYIDDNDILSRDEKEIINVDKFKDIKIKCAFNLNARNWKERAIITIN